MDHSAFDPVRADLEAAQVALADLAAAGGAGRGQLRVLDERRLPYSAVRRVEWRSPDGATRRYFLKRLIPRHGTREEWGDCLRRERALLERLGTTLPGQVVEVAAVLPERLVMITAECPGAAFNRKLSWSLLRSLLPAYPRRIVAEAAACGSWLRRFHEGTTRLGGEAREWLTFQTQGVEWRAHRLAELDPTRRDLYAEAARRLVSDLLELELGEKVCMTHGDFAPHNVFLADGRAVVLDFLDARVGVGASDLVNFLASLATRCESRMESRRLMRGASLALLEAYGRLPAESARLWPRLLVFQSLKRQLVLQQGKSSRRSPLGPRLPCDWYVRHLESYLRLGADHRDVARGPWPFLVLNEGGGEWSAR